MSDKIRLFYYVLWIAQPVLGTGIAVAMWRRGQRRQFKYFFFYIVAQILTFAVVFPLRRNYSAFFYASWISTAIMAALGFKVIHEAFLDAFRPFHTLRDLGTVLFKWAGLVMLLVAGVVSVSTNSLDTAPWVQAILTAQRVTWE
jgi:putative Mn2+ efflux pump MntP